ncbi:MAG: hypothetical protein ACSLE2_10855 [Lysobacterales bacterium]
MTTRNDTPNTGGSYTRSEDGKLHKHGSRPQKEATKPAAKPKKPARKAASKSTKEG